MAGVLSLLIVFCLAWQWPAQAEDHITVFAASSLQTALDDAIKAFREHGGGTIVASYAGSSALAKQIEQGAPADIFISADTDWMDYLDGKGLIDSKSRRDFWSNDLVLIAPKGHLPAIDLKSGVDLSSALNGGLFAVANMQSVPAGRYARAALLALDAFSSVGNHFVEVENVRLALALVARGETPLGIVYKTDALAEPGVAIVATFPKDSYPRILYPGALVKRNGAGGSADAFSRNFLSFLQSPVVRSIFARRGFQVLD